MKADQELIIKFQLFEQQIKQVQEQLQAVEQGIVEMNTLSSGLGDLIGAEGKEIMAPIGRGIFAKAQLLSEELLVDVGGKNFVQKSIPDTQRIIKEQTEKLEEVRGELNNNLEEINQELTKVFMEATAKQKTCGCGGDCSEEECSCEECDCKDD